MLLLIMQLGHTGKCMTKVEEDPNFVPVKTVRGPRYDYSLGDRIYIMRDTKNDNICYVYSSGGISCVPIKRDTSDLSL